MFSMQSVEDRASRREGMRSFMYHDDKGIPTVAKGFNLTRPDAKARLAAVGADWSLVIVGRQGLSVQQANDLLAYDLGVAIADLRTIFPSFDSMPDPAQEALIDIRYNEGPEGFRTHVNTIADLKRGDFLSAAGRLSVSQWARDVGSERSGEDLDLLRSAAQIARNEGVPTWHDDDVPPGHDDGSQGPECA